MVAAIVGRLFSGLQPKNLTEPKTFTCLTGPCRSVAAVVGLGLRLVNWRGSLGSC